MHFYDIHTHTFSSGHEPDLTRIYNVSLPHPELQAPFSVGILPWEIDSDPRTQIEQTIRLSELPGCVAIGECGIDNLRCSRPDIQTDVFREMIRISEQQAKPLIVHGVKAEAELIALRRTLRPHQPWILHGFRGKPQQAQQFLTHGFLFSLGPRFREDTIRALPDDCFFIESDDSGCSVVAVYHHSASVRNCSVAQLADRVEKGVERVFGLNRGDYKK